MGVGQFVPRIGTVPITSVSLRVVTRRIGSRSRLGGGSFGMTQD